MVSKISLRLRHRVLPSPPSTGSGHPQGVQCQPALLSNLEPAARVTPARSATTEYPATFIAKRELNRVKILFAFITMRDPDSGDVGRNGWLNFIPEGIIRAN